MSTGPSCFFVSAISLSHCALSEMLQGMTIASPPAFRISAAASSQTGALRDDTTTLAPDRARCMAIDLPMPLLEPVTTATLPERSKSGELILSPPKTVPSLLRTIVAVQEGGIGIEAEARPGRHVERGLPARHSDTVGIHRVVRLDGGEVTFPFA